MLPRSFYFLRHGETDWNKEGRLQGAIDIPLNENGREQARLALPVLQKYPIDRIVSSDLSRALETAQIINDVLQKPLDVDLRLREKFFGVYEGKTRDDIEQWKLDNPDLVLPVDPETGHTSPPGGETHQQVRSRVLELKQEMLTKHPEENILFVSHGGIYRVLCSVLGQELNQSPNAKPFHFMRHAPEQWTLVHLD